jgi:hypothetical protein
MAIGLGAVDWNQYTTNQQVYHQPYEQFAPVYAPKKSIQLDYSYAPSIFIESPNSKGATITTKKDASLSGDVASSPSLTSSADAALGSGNNSLLTLALIGGIAIIGIYFITKKKE